jgi:HD superfamily phosphodiesterase
MSSAVVRVAHAKVWVAVKDRWMPNAAFGHGVDHAERAYTHGRHLAQREVADQLAVGAACYLMDAGLDPVNGRRRHVERSIRIADSVIDTIAELQPIRDLILHAIAHHEAEQDPPVGSPPETLVVRDSDTLDRLGLTGIRMTLAYGQWTSRPLCNPDDPVCENGEPVLDAFSMDYCRYLFSLPERLATETARAVAQAKVNEMTAYFDAFKAFCTTERGPSYEDAFALANVIATAQYYRAI